MSFKPRYYQSSALVDIKEQFLTYNKVLYQLQTSGGKTFIFSMLTKEYAQNDKKVLILCDSEDLVDQTVKSLLRIGIISETIMSDKQKLKNNTNVYVAMVETINNRLVKDMSFLPHVDLVICDECHILVFNKVFDKYPNAKVLGCTATPVLSYRETYFKCDFCNTIHPENTECCGIETMEWTKPMTMSKFFDTIVCGPTNEEMFKHGYLTPENAVVRTMQGIDGLKEDSSTDSGFSSKSLESVFNSEQAVIDTVNVYKEFLEGRKTMIFTSNTKANVLLVNAFKEAGICNVRSYDTRNNKKKERKEIVKWFKENQDGILISRGCFTKGFDDVNVEGVILALDTMSLAQFLQMLGRAARVTDDIYKPFFTAIDLGRNYERFQLWSYDRDWEDIFFNGIGEHKPKKQALERIKVCSSCGGMYNTFKRACPECGHIEEEPLKKEKELKETNLDDFQVVAPIPPPSGEMIYKFVVSQEKDINFAFRTLENYVVQMFTMYRVSKGTYINTKNNGKLDERIKAMVNKCYHVLTSKTDIIPQNWQGRKIDTIIERIKKKLDKKYGIFTISQSESNSERNT